MQINWFPGHMKKSVDEIQKQLPLIDVCCEIVDARIPQSGVNQLLRKITQSKPLLTILNKRDLAEENETTAWIAHIQQSRHMALAFNARTDRNYAEILRAARALTAEQRARRRAKGMAKQEMRMLVFGIPNSGKSTWINTMAGRRSAKVGNRPGVTTQKQWIKTGELLLLDTPGILWPKLEQRQALHLAYTGAIRDEVLDIRELALSLLQDLLQLDAARVYDRYGVAGADPMGLLQEIGRKTGALQRGGMIDEERAAKTLLDDFRKTRLGRLTLERVPR